MIKNYFMTILKDEPREISIKCIVDDYQNFIDQIYQNEGALKTIEDYFYLDQFIKFEKEHNYVEYTYYFDNLYGKTGKEIITDLENRVEEYKEKHPDGFQEYGKKRILFLEDQFIQCTVKHRGEKRRLDIFDSAYQISNIQHELSYLTEYMDLSNIYFVLNIMNLKTQVENNGWKTYVRKKQLYSEKIKSDEHVKELILKYEENR